MWSAASPGRNLPPGKTRYPFYRRLSGPQGRSGRAENLVTNGIRSRTVQPVTQSLYRLSYRAHKMNTVLILKSAIVTCPQYVQQVQGTEGHTTRWSTPSKMPLLLFLSQVKQVLMILKSFRHFNIAPLGISSKILYIFLLSLCTLRA